MTKKWSSFPFIKEKKDIFLNGRIWSYLFLWRYNQFCRRCTIIFQNVFCIIFSEQCSCCCLFGTILTNDSRVLLAKRGIFSRRQTNVVALFKNKMYMLDEMGGPSNFAIVLEYEIQRIFGGFSILHLFSDLVTVVLRCLLFTKSSLFSKSSLDKM